MNEQAVVDVEIGDLVRMTDGEWVVADIRNGQINLVKVEGM